MGARRWVAAWRRRSDARGVGRRRAARAMDPPSRNGHQLRRAGSRAHLRRRPPRRSTSRRNEGRPDPRRRRPAGKVGSASVALDGWASMSHPDLLRMPDGTLRSFFGGIRSTSPGETNNAMNTATAPARGTTWTLKPGKAAQAVYAYITGVTGGALRRTERRSRPGPELRASASTTASTPRSPTAASRRRAAASTTRRSRSTRPAARPGSASTRTRTRGPECS